MKYGILLSLALAVVPSAWSQETSEEERKDGFVSLFNGKDFDGWRFTGGKKDLVLPPKNWAVADGMIRLSGGASPHLASEWDYEDFDVRLQWKAHKKGYNSGFYVRSGRAVGANQINLAQTDCGHLLGGPKEARAVPELQKKPGEWNDWRVRAVGGKLTFWANGKQAWEIAHFKPARGYLGLQAEGAAIDFKNIRIKELGFNSLNDVARWRHDDGKPVKELVVKGKNRGIETKNGGYTDYVFRVEFKAATRGTFRFGFRNALLESVNDSKKNRDRPAGQWNYLELRVQDNQSWVWLNGVWLWEKVSLRNAAAKGVVALGTDGDRITFRNPRIKELKAGKKGE
jgi:hypothetical protein